MACSCTRDGLCDRCVDDGFAQLRGVAACRGEHWGAHLPASSRPWNADKALAIARRKVDDLARDPRLRERLAAELARWGEHRWRAGGISAANWQTLLPATRNQ